MRVLSLVLAATFVASPAVAQQPAPIRASVARAIEATPEAAPAQSGTAGGKGARFWSGLALGIAGATTSALGLTVLRTESTSTGNAPDGTYLACVAQKNSSAIYANNQCDALKGKNLKLLWGGVALGGVGAALMVSGLGMSADLSSGGVRVFHRLYF